ncbi:unnamed protein product (macronuclear) [Paramecium tetraurelia]|uniref:G-protein coupled receptors family 2 profile 2 domain-containing protein n=1 Tax=Paramecium tetraurelia TaxID=5888 RepID=A0EI09_PARTE|nr:uncharacterized protein GSPATT00027277001 [Paramecium tetraurelia]CAK94950.1 unnamed protein product [Paramecium tetraurelia]|eukprot:XP_001462323.1 hypothetical protein (macronuclear) [Paramecium tetraurelia strain d4-2]
MYFYDYNPILIAQFCCIAMSLLSVIGVIIVFILGKGWRYFIVILFFTQIICMLFFYVPQVLTPFIFYDESESTENDFCQFKQNNENDQQCIQQTFCKLQGYFINSSFLASTLISLYSSYIIQQTLNPNSQIGKKVKQIYWIHFGIGIFTFTICIPMLFKAQYNHYGTSWGNQLIYYVCNLEIESDHLYTQTVFWLQTTITTALILVGIKFHWSAKKLKSKIRTNFVGEFDACSSLNLYILPITLLIFWTINVMQKLIDFKSDYIRQSGYAIQAIWFLPQLLLALQGFNYASLFFYAFYLQLVPNLPKSLQSTYLFFAKISFYNCIYGRIAESKILKDSLLYEADSAKDSTSSYIQKDDSSTNR